NSDSGPAIFEDVLVDGLKANDTLILWGPLFKHVTLEGKILGGLKINSWATSDPQRETSKTEREFAAARRDFYDGLEWALDLDSAQVGGELDMRGVPARLVRRDPESQVIVTRERARKKGWRSKLSPSNEWWPFVIDMFLEDGDADVVLVAHRSG